jgi:hypothetical protein
MVDDGGQRGPLARDVDEVAEKKYMYILKTLLSMKV